MKRPVYSHQCRLFTDHVAYVLFIFKKIYPFLYLMFFFYQDFVPVNNIWRTTI